MFAPLGRRENFSSIGIALGVSDAVLSMCSRIKGETQYFGTSNMSSIVLPICEMSLVLYSAGLGV